MRSLLRPPPPEEGILDPLEITAEDFGSSAAARELELRRLKK